VQRWGVEDKEVRVASREPLKLALRLLNYPAWQVEVNGKKITPEKAEDSGQMIVPVVAGESRIEVHLVRTPDRDLGAVLSVISLFALFMMLWTSRSGQQ
jgi:hypothetical protein